MNPGLRIRLLPSTVGRDGDCQYATSFVINETIAIDAGSAGFHSDPDGQRAIRHVLLTHSHADHVASLPILLENTFDEHAPNIGVWGNRSVLESLRSDMFNDRVWPNLATLSPGEHSFVELHELRAEEPVELDGLKITPVAVDHTVDTLGFIIEAQDCAVVLPSDTAPTTRIWELARRTANVAAVFLEASFPDAMGELAAASMHLTPSQFGVEIAKLDRAVPVIAVHLKPRFRQQIITELEALGLPNLEIGRPGKEYSW